MSTVFDGEFWEQGEEGERGRGGGRLRRPSAQRPRWRGGRGGTRRPQRRRWPKRPWPLYPYAYPYPTAVRPLEPEPPPEEPLPPEPPLPPESASPPEEEPPEGTAPDAAPQEEWRVRRRLRWQGLADR